MTFDPLYDPNQYNARYGEPVQQLALQEEYQPPQQLSPVDPYETIVPEQAQQSAAQVLEDLKRLEASHELSRHGVNNFHRQARADGDRIDNFSRRYDAAVTAVATLNTSGPVFTAILSRLKTKGEAIKEFKLAAQANASSAAVCAERVAYIDQTLPGTSNSYYNLHHDLFGDNDATPEARRRVANITNSNLSDDIFSAGEYRFDDYHDDASLIVRQHEQTPGEKLAQYERLEAELVELRRERPIKIARLKEIADLAGFHTARIQGLEQEYAKIEADILHHNTVYMQAVEDLRALSIEQAVASPQLPVEQLPQMSRVQILATKFGPPALMAAGRYGFGGDGQRRSARHRELPQGQGGSQLQIESPK